MRILNIEVTLVEIKHNTGFAKGSGKAYDFHTLVFADENFNRMQAVFSRVLGETWGNIIPPALYEKAKNHGKLSVDFEILPDASGYGVKLEVADINIP